MFIKTILKNLQLFHINLFFFKSLSFTIDKMLSSVCPKMTCKMQCCGSVLDAKLLYYPTQEYNILPLYILPIPKGSRKKICFLMVRPLRGGGQVA